ncbi:hypothetical protein Tco_1227803 [Tanacetum coccineum]
MHCVGRLVGNNKSKRKETSRKKGKGKVIRHKQVLPFIPKPNPKKRKEKSNKDQACPPCHMTGHWKRKLCPLYLDLMLKGKLGLWGSISCNMGNGAQAGIMAESQITELDGTVSCCVCNAIKDDTKSQTGYVCVVNGGSKLAMKQFGLGSLLKGILACDAFNSARHFLRRYHFVREQVESGEIKILKVHTDDNLADPFTKALPRGKVTDHANGIGLQLASSFMHTCD